LTILQTFYKKMESFSERQLFYSDSKFQRSAIDIIWLLVISCGFDNIAQRIDLGGALSIPLDAPPSIARVTSGAT